MQVSVVAPTFRRPDLLARCLAALASQDLDPTAYEIVVADDAASDDTRRQVESFALTARPAVRYQPVTGRHGPAAARNVGWRAAVAPLIAFTDDDTVPEPGWLTAGLAAFAEHPDAAAVTGRVIVPLPPRPTDYERNESGLERAEFVTANCFVRRSVLEEVGGFDERFTAAWREDSDLHFAILERCGRVVRASKAVVVHPVRPGRWGVSLRQQRKSQFDALFFKKHTELYRRRIGGPPWDYYGIITAAGVAIVAAVMGVPGLALAAAAIWLLLTGLFLRRRLRGNSLAPRHVAEMVVTSALIPPLSVFWRLAGAAKFRAWFA
jgi:GT2 family glycosyltransferase